MEDKKTFSRCPACGSERRFCEELAKEQKSLGRARAEWVFTYDARSGPVVDPNREMLMPIGAIVPAFYILVDICMDCGTLYATRLDKMEGRLELRKSSDGGGARK